MTPMSVRALITESRWGYIPVLVVMALVVGAGCCLFDGHADDDAGLDLCFGMLAVAVVAALLGRLRQSGLIPALAPVLLTGTGPHVLDPPPRLLA